MTRYTKVDGMYLIKGQKFEMLEGSRAQVVHKTAYKTSGGLKLNDLVQNKHGRIVSKKKHHTAKKENRLIKAGFGTKKGHFGFVKLNKSSRRQGSRKMKGGKGTQSVNPSPEMVDGSAPHSLTGGRKRRRGGNATTMNNALGSLKNMSSGVLDKMMNSVKPSSSGPANLHK